VVLELGADRGCVSIMDADRLRAIEGFCVILVWSLCMMIQDATVAEVILVGVQPEATVFVAELSISGIRFYTSWRNFLYMCIIIDPMVRFDLAP